jgi:hypothetical protein
VGAGRSRKPLNDTEQVKHDDAPLNVKDRIENSHSKMVSTATDPAIRPAARQESEQWTSKRYRRKSTPGECIAVPARDR